MTDIVVDFVSEYVYALVFFGALATVGLLFHGWDWIVARIKGD